MTSQNLHFYLESQLIGLQLILKAPTAECTWGPSQGTALLAESPFHKQATLKSPHRRVPTFLHEGGEKREREMAANRDSFPFAAAV